MFTFFYYEMLNFIHEVVRLNSVVSCITFLTQMKSSKNSFMNTMIQLQFKLVIYNSFFLFSYNLKHKNMII